MERRPSLYWAIPIGITGITMGIGHLTRCFCMYLLLIVDPIASAPVDRKGWNLPWSVDLEAVTDMLLISTQLVDVAWGGVERHRSGV